MKNTNSSQLCLPGEIVDDILLCLPAKSLLRFKLVSKPWNSLISGPNFAQSHLNRSNTLISQGERCGNLLRLGQISISKRKHRPDGQGPRPSLSLDSMDADGSHREVVTIDLGLQRYSNRPSILGSCNGLLLVLVNRVDFFLLNPLTRQYKKISPVRLHGGDRLISGLGYESTSGNYKGIIATHSHGGPSSPHIIYDYVYDYKLNNWKRRREFHYGVKYDDSAVMVNGIPHWCVYRQRIQPLEEAADGEGYVSYDLIVYVDLKTEEVKEVELPLWAATGEKRFNLGVLGGCLCMSLDPRGSSTSIEVWAMKEYGIAESWTKLFAINSSFFRQLLLRPICFTGTGRNKVLMQGTYGGKIIIFNLKEELEKLLALYKYGSTVCTYVGSLVFPEEEVGNEAIAQGID
ncbi:hypothetical protein COLO4_21634 [Corchorus olitorius]|uniref:F-box domain-containing protein n=1 Tax=Corchorus olitorius TaxID=93759 RepID=A0A1R3IS60_9ROSI|nr:hypothetical protein COLO4_21634 [Corchorus olitorius]